MKIGIDASWMVGNYRGMGRFARQLIDPIRNEIVALVPKRIKVDEWPYVNGGNGFFPWWEQIEIPRLCFKEDLDILLSPYNTGPLTSIGKTKSIAVVHDLIFMQPWSILPPSLSPFQTLGRVYRRSVVPTFAKRSDTIITVSHFTKNELMDKFKISENKIHVIPNSISEDWFIPPIPLESRKPYIFTVAGESPSKNVMRLLEAFSIALPKLGKNISLKIAGIKSNYQRNFQLKAIKLGIGDHVEFLGFVSDHELRQLYREAKGFVFASLFEGFGIPLLEAMASGTPIACSNTTSIPEVVGESAFFFNPISKEEIAVQIIKLCESNEVLESKSKSALIRVQSFSESNVSQRIDFFWKHKI